MEDARKEGESNVPPSQERQSALRKAAEEATELSEGQTEGSVGKFLDNKAKPQTYSS